MIEASYVVCLEDRRASYLKASTLREVDTATGHRLLHPIRVNDGALESTAEMILTSDVEKN
jgi:hypothetical protein